MKASLVLLVVGGALVSGLPASADSLNSRVAEVTVYRDRALVTRTGGTTLERGVREVVFDKLPNGLDENSIRAGGEGSARFKILGVEMRREYQKPSQSGEVAQLQESLRHLDDRRNAINDERNNLNQQQQFLARLRDKVLADTQKVSQESQLVSAKSLEEIFAFYSGELTQISDRLRGLQLEERDLSEERQELHKQISLLQRPSDPDTRTAVVKVEVTRPGSASFRLSYLIDGASWTPQYDAFAQTKDKKVNLTYYGVVRQTTGENWDSVKLSLSTARPNQNARLPELNTWTISLLRPQVVSGLSAKPGIAFGEARDQFSVATNDEQRDNTLFKREPAREETEKKAAEALAVIVDNGPVATFEVPGTTTIPSDGQSHRTTVEQLALRAEFAYETTPKLTAAAFLRATATNTSGAPLLPGRINVFQGNDYIGQSQLHLVAPAAEFKLYLGVDDGIKITRDVKVEKEGIGGLLTSVKEYRRGYTIKVENFKAKAKKIIVHDQLPVSRTDEVKVDVEHLSPGVQRDKDTGELTWEFTLAPQKKKTLKVDYEVTCPANATVAGL